MTDLQILHLYPKTLRLNGEVGNVVALRRRAETSGFDVTVALVEMGEKLPTVMPQIIFLGSGTNTAMLLAAKDLRDKIDQIRSWVAEGTKVLAVGAGFDLISKGVRLPDGNFVEGLDLTDTTHTITNRHMVGEVWVSNSFAGFLNSDREISRGDASRALGVVAASENSKLLGYFDGYRHENIWASCIQGPLLPMNPMICDEILSAIYPNMQNSGELAQLDQLAARAREAILRRVGN